MSHTRPMSYDSARAPKRCPSVFVGVMLAVSFATACGGTKMQKVSIDIGGGMRKGDPPMCFQYRSEARATTRANNIWMMINNTCRYMVDCNIYDDVTEREHRVAIPGFQTVSYIVATEVPQSRVSTKFDCTWKP